jgi:hypothetical protein
VSGRRRRVWPAGAKACLRGSGLLLAVFGPRRLLRSASLIGGLAAFLFVTYLLAPVVNPVSVVLALRSPSTETVAGLSPAAFLVVVDTALCLLLTIGVTVVLSSARRAA